MKQMIDKPIIGITVDFLNHKSYSKYPWYALKKNYADAISSFGGVPILLSCNTRNIADYVKIIDGLIITGGDFDIDPHYYGQNITSETVRINSTRTNFEIEILRQFLDLNRPVLGICGGMQLINIIKGGSLIQDIAEEMGSSFHKQGMPKHITTHTARIKNGTILHNILQKEIIDVNTSHHQAVKTLGDGVILSAEAPDKIIEAVEIPDYKFCLGIQWHPEYLETNADKQIFKAFIQAIGK
ncbi:MAG: gamma-glutamyl-gamma-aminobutyrate hydrolase family protein [Candidatus Midichloria sp.]|nr:MAG: gamma-glutamyl-gamma-aminobutyrate hydrolase family protein [Candidatus Midichloria sp.]